MKRWLDSKSPFPNCGLLLSVQLRFFLCVVLLVFFEVSGLSEDQTAKEGRLVIIPNELSGFRGFDDRPEIAVVLGEQTIPFERAIELVRSFYADRSFKRISVCSVNKLHRVKISACVQVWLIGTDLSVLSRLSDDTRELYIIDPKSRAPEANLRPFAAVILMEGNESSSINASWRDWTARFNRPLRIVGNTSVRELGRALTQVSGEIDILRSEAQY